MLSEEDFKYKYLQQPITFLTEENLDKLEDRCRKAIHYERGVEHKVVLELLERYEELLAEREKNKKRIKELEEENKKYIVQLTSKQYRNLEENTDWIGTYEILNALTGIKIEIDNTIKENYEFIYD